MEKSKGPKYFFVYGTLKVDGRLARPFDKARVSSIHAVLEGFDLFDLGWFPGIKTGKGVVYGELHEYVDTLTARTAFDKIECFNPDTPTSSLYVRETVTALTEDNKRVNAYVYIFNQDVDKFDARKIESGIWDN